MGRGWGATEGSDPGSCGEENALWCLHMCNLPHCSLTETVSCLSLSWPMDLIN